MPAIRKLRRERSNTGGTDEALYCYSVFLRHYAVAKRNGLSVTPKTVLELGPGDSIGVGLCWLLCGAEVYHALDAAQYASADKSLAIFDELVRLFEREAPIPRNLVEVKTEVRPLLDGDESPVGKVDLSPERLAAIREAIKEMGGPSGRNIRIAYSAPWNAATPIPAASVDIVYSQAVMEHVMDLDGTYAAMARWLRPGGYISHQIDFKSHGSSFDWNGHWMYSERQWKKAKSKHAYLAINRKPCSHHLDLISRSGFEILSVIRVETEGGINRRHLARDWAAMPDDDLICSGVHVLARKSKRANGRTA